MFKITYTMNRIIFCNFLKSNEEGFEFQFYPGDIGKKIYNDISKKAWSKWMKKQTLIINEKKLNMIKLKDRKFLENEMVNFFYKKKNKI